MSSSVQITELLQRGISAAKAGRPQEARQALLKVTELDERNEQAWLWLSGVVESSEDRRICLENALTINPENAHAQAGLRWLDQQSPASPEWEERCPRCDSPVPPSGTACPHCGQVLVVACPACGEYIEAQETACPRCGESLGDFRQGAAYHLALARAYMERQRYVMAQEAIRHAEAESPADPRVLQSAATLYEEIGHTDMAIAVYKEAIERDPEDATLYARLGAIYRRRSMPAEARTMYELAAERAGDAPEILFELAQLYQEDGARMEAFKLLEQTVSLQPEHAEAHVLLGDLNLAARRGQRAIDHYERASELTSPRSLLGREARLKLGKLRPSMPARQAQGWAETLRQMVGLMLPPALAALVNARMVPWEISLAAWVALMVAGLGAYLWVCAINVPRNPLMRELFGRKGVDGVGRQILVGLPGVALWGAALGLILSKL